MNSLGSRLKELRTRRGWSQDDLAKMIGVKRTSIAMYETDKRNIRPEVMYKLMEALGVTIQELLPEKAQDVEGSIDGREDCTADQHRSHIAALYELCTRTGINVDELKDIDEKYRKFAEETKIRMPEKCILTPEWLLLGIYRSEQPELFENELTMKVSSLNLQGKLVLNGILDLLLDLYPRASQRINPEKKKEV